jgi:hypothetical protein
VLANPIFYLWKLKTGLEQLEPRKYNGAAKQSQLRKIDSFVVVANKGVQTFSRRETLKSVIDNVLFKSGNIAKPVERIYLKTIGEKSVFTAASESPHTSKQEAK